MRSAGEATRDRILAAAKDEFATYGLAGARINRIAAQARASKDRLYAYFASKEELFAAVTEQWTSETTAETALRGDDLPGYAGRLFDNYVAHPENARLQQWADLEAPDVMSEDDIRSKTFRPKVAEIRKGAARGAHRPPRVESHGVDPADHGYRPDARAQVVSFHPSTSGGGSRGGSAFDCGLASPNANVHARRCVVARIYGFLSNGAYVGRRLVDALGMLTCRQNFCRRLFRCW